MVLNHEITEASNEILSAIANEKFKKIVIIAGHYCLSPELEELSSNSETEIFTFNLGVIIYNKLRLLKKDVQIVLWINDIGIDKETRKNIKENYQIPENYKVILDKNKVNYNQVNIIFESTSRNSASVLFRKVYKKTPEKFKVLSSNDKSLVRCIDKDNCSVIENTKAYTIEDKNGAPIVMKEGSNPKCNLILGTLYRSIVNKYQPDSILNIFNDIYIERIRLGTYVGKKVYDLNVNFINYFCDEDSIYSENYDS